MCVPGVPQVCPRCAPGVSCVRHVCVPRASRVHPVCIPCASHVHPVCTRVHPCAPRVRPVCVPCVSHVCHGANFYIIFQKNIAPLGFDPRTFGLWAQHASSAPRSIESLIFALQVHNWIVIAIKQKNVIPRFFHIHKIF